MAVRKAIGLAEQELKTAVHYTPERIEQEYRHDRRAWTVFRIIVFVEVGSVLSDFMSYFVGRGPITTWDMLFTSGTSLALAVVLYYAQATIRIRADRIKGLQEHVAILKSHNELLKRQVQRLGG